MLIYLDIHCIQLTALCVSDIVQMIKPYTNQEDFERSKSIIAKLITSDGLLKKDCLPDVALELQQLAPNADIGSLVNWLGNIPEIIDEPDNSAQMEKLFQVVRNAREETGICSLTQLKDDAAMWNDYADNDRGYCVEFDMSNYQYQQMLFPVVYEDNRQNNIFMTIISDFVGQMTVEVSQGEFNADRSSRLRMFLTKDTKWAAQEEWRLIGKAHQKLTAPSIKAIYLGKNASEGDRKQMKTFCQTYKIQLIQR